MSLIVLPFYRKFMSGDHAKKIIKKKLLDIIHLFLIYFTAIVCDYVSLISYMHIQPLSNNVAAA